MSHYTGAARSARTFSLKPGDRLLIYTDGVVDAKGANHEFFGLARFTDFVIRAAAPGRRLRRRCAG
nr:SpoIIE family protein phosphatase [Streptomyces sp. Li-HN-5-13]